MVQETGPGKMNGGSQLTLQLPAAVKVSVKLEEAVAADREIRIPQTSSQRSAPKRDRLIRQRHRQRPCAICWRCIHYPPSKVPPSRRWDNCRHRFPLQAHTPKPVAT